jgi:hypothetical protein
LDDTLKLTPFNVVEQRLSVKRRHEDPTATPSVWKKRMLSLQQGAAVFKTPHAGPPSSTGKFLPKGGRSSHQPAPRPGSVTGSKVGSGVRAQRLTVVEHNTTVHARPHAQRQAAQEALNSTFVL